jgi:hypothetical protein
LVIKEGNVVLYLNILFPAPKSKIKLKKAFFTNTKIEKFLFNLNKDYKINKILLKRA